MPEFDRLEAYRQKRDYYQAKLDAEANIPYRVGAEGNDPMREVTAEFHEYLQAQVLIYEGCMMREQKDRAEGRG